VPLAARTELVSKDALDASQSDIATYLAKNRTGICIKKRAKKSPPLPKINNMAVAAWQQQQQHQQLLI
jgi:hypothetical protein